MAQFDVHRNTGKQRESLLLLALEFLGLMLLKMTTTLFDN